jgi:hypothetical protein
MARRYSMPFPDGKRYPADDRLILFKIADLTTNSPNRATIKKYSLPIFVSS